MPVGDCDLCGYWHEWNRPCVVPRDDAAVVAAYRAQAYPSLPPPPRPRPARGVFINTAGTGYAPIFDEAPPPMDWNQAQAAIRAARISHAVQDALQEYLGRGLWLDMLSAHETDPQGVMYCSRCWPFITAVRARYRALVDTGAV